MKRKIHSSVLVVFWSLGLVLGLRPAFAQEEDPKVLAERLAAIELRLPETTGRERFELLVELVDLYLLQRVEKLQPIGEPATEALAMLPEYPDPVRELILSKGLLHYYAYRRELEKALLVGLRAKELAGTVGSAGDRAFVARRMGDVYRYSGELPAALTEYVEAQKLFEQLGDDFRLGNVLNNIGLIYGTRAEYSAELNYYLLARAAFLRAGELGNAAMVSANLGGCYEKMGRIDEARTHLENALAEAKASGKEKVFADSLIGLGEFWLSHEKKPREALALIQQALELYRKQDRPGRVVDAGIQLSRAHLALGNDTASMASLEEPLALAKKLEMPLNQGEVLVQLAEVHLRRGHTDLAVIQLEKAVAILRPHDLQEYLIPALKKLAGAYAAAGRPAEAYSSLEEYSSLREKFWSREIQQQVADLQVRSEAQEKEKEIVLLKRDQELKEAELARQKQLRRGLIALLIGSLVILGLLYRQYRLSLRAARMGERLIHEQERNEELEKIDRVKDQFVANTSHELRTPLYGILGLVEVLHSDETADLSPSVREKLKWILGSAQRLDQLVGDLLDFSKLRAGNIELLKRPADLAKLVDATIELFEPQVASRKLNLVVDIPANLPAVEADKRRLGQILFHLIGNAIKFTSAGKVEISASHEGGRIRVTVRDSGPGIAEADQQRIFRAFEQADGSAERSHGGTGLGLALCRELVRLHGSELELESALGQGSSFRFSLPISAQPPAAIEAAAAPPPGPAKILVVDDEPVNRLLLEHQLLAAGYEVQEAIDGFEALARLDGIDLVLLDIMMPGMSGYEVCRQLRQRYSAEALPVIFVSAKEQAEDMAAAKAAGGNDYLTKPVPMAELLGRVEAQLERRAAVSIN